jgi:hypothetical protein
MIKVIELCPFRACDHFLYIAMGNDMPIAMEIRAFQADKS